MHRIGYKFFLQSQTHTATAKMRAIQKGRAQSALSATPFLKIQSFTEPLLFHWIFKEKAQTDNKLTKGTKSSKQTLPC